jgi:hypothetical protein
MKSQRLLLSLTLTVCCLMMVMNVRAAGSVSGKVTIEDQSSNAEFVSASTKPISGNHATSEENGAARNVIVYVAPAAGHDTASNRQPLSIAHDGCHLSEAVRQLGFVPVAAYTGQFVNRADEEIIPVKCDIKAGGRKYFVVQKPSQFSVTAEDGTFTLSGLLPGKYTITAWDESCGAQSQEVTITGDETVAANFVFRPKSKT